MMMTAEIRNLEPELLHIAVVAIPIHTFVESLNYLSLKLIPRTDFIVSGATSFQSNSIVVSIAKEVIVR